MSDPFVDQLAALCRAHPTRAKWVFVPTHAVGWTLGDRLVLEGCDWANLRFVTPLAIALRMGAPFLVEQGIDPSEEGLGPALMMRLLLDLPGNGGYFKPLADQPTMAQALWTTIRELRIAGVKSDDLRPEAFESSAKHEELRALLAAYEQFLVRTKRGDMAVVFAEAPKHLDWCPIQKQACWTELPDVAWGPLQRTLIDIMPGERINPRILDLPGTKLPRRIGAQPVERIAPDAGTNPLAFLMTPDGAGGQRPGQNIDLFHAGGREAEIEEVFRRVLKAGVSLDQVEIVCASELAAQLAWEKALRLDWAVTIASGVPAVLTKPGRALLAFCDWIESDFTASHLRRVLQSGDLRPENMGDLTAGQAARLLVKAEAAWGRATYGLALTRLQTKYEREAADANLTDDSRASAATKASQVAQLRQWIEELLDAIPVEDANRHVPLDRAVAVALTFLENCTARSSALDGAATKALADSITELNALGTFSCRLATALRFIRERVEGVSVGSERPRPGYLHVSTLSHFGVAGRPLLFVVGLEEGRVFPAAVEDPVLLDSERMNINKALRLSKDRVDEAVWAALSRLATYGGSVVLSYSSRDLREYRETYASWLMLQAFRVKHGDGAKSYRDLHAALGEARSCVPETRDTATTDTGWWLSSLKQAGDSVVPALLEHFPAIAQGRAAETLRAGAAFTVYDGFVPEAGKILDPCANARGVSATALEDAAECGFRYFLQRGLRLDAIDTGDRDGDVWLDPLVRGNELHNLYAAALRRCRDGGRRPHLTTDLPWLLDQARIRLAQLRVEMPPPSDEVFELESRDLLADLELFLLEECEGLESRTPVGLEVAFGSPRGTDKDGAAESLAQQEPIEIDLGGGLKFRLTGRIDRIDQIGLESFEVIDYKTGTYWEKKWAGGVFRGGTRLQHALYGLAAAELLRRKNTKGSVAAGVYYFPSAKGGKERRTIPAPTKAELAGVLGDLRGMIASGTFLHTSDAGDCKYCEYFRACGAPTAVGRVEEKLTDPKLALRKALAGHG